MFATWKIILVNKYCNLRDSAIANFYVIHASKSSHSVFALRFSTDARIRDAKHIERKKRAQLGKLVPQRRITRARAEAGSKDNRVQLAHEI